MSGGRLLMLRYQKKLMALLIKDDRLLSVKVYEEEARSLVGNIYVGKVQSIAGNIGAAFVEISGRQICFLPLADAAQACVTGREYDGRLKAGDELLVQVVRDAVKTKQPSLTTRLSLAGNYLAVSYGSGRLGLSAKLAPGKKKEITDFLRREGLLDEAQCCLFGDGSPMTDMGMVVRTNAGMLKDLQPVAVEWKLLAEKLRHIIFAAEHRTCFSCLRENSRPCLEDLKNYYAGDFEEVVTDCTDIYEAYVRYAEENQRTSGFVLPPIRLYQDEYPLEKLYSVRTKLEGALNSRVWLKSGGYLVIEPTEALTVIDVNTGKCVAGRHSEDTFCAINMEAAAEIALQLRLRNLSGIILVDFINMESEERKAELLRRLDSMVKKDSVRTNVVDMTPLGLVEITRKRISKPLRELLQPLKI